MADILSVAARSVLMGRIRGRGNASTEMAMAKLFREHGITGWRRHLQVPGRPDFVFPKERVAVFVDGCFWHGCPLHFKAPGNRAEFWRVKIAGNRTRDRRVDRKLRSAGWSVLRIWEHALSRRYQAASLGRVRAALAASGAKTAKKR